MPRRTDIETVLVIGSGPIVIGQACEFDYSGTQAVRVLRNYGYRVVLVNSNPATIMTDPELADATYVEPITAETVGAVIDAEQPDALLPTLGGQTALNVTTELARMGILEEKGVEVIGASLESIETAEDRGRFKTAMEAIGIATARSRYVGNLEGAVGAAAELGYPVMVRPSYILGGGGTGLAENESELRDLVGRGLDASPIREVLVEESLRGWKEFELEVMRDRAHNAVIVCSIENLDPMGVHTGDSITVAPAMTLSDREYQDMRDEAIACLDAVGVETGGSNVQFAVDPRTGRRVIVEMNPRVSRSSALASKATGFPIAKIAAQLAVGYTLDEITNEITGATPASFEPALDYVVVKAPRFDFAKFPSARPVLGTSMQSVGEAMAIGRTFPEALQKALRSLETGRAGLNADQREGVVAARATDELRSAVASPTPERLYEIAELLRRGEPADDLAEGTGIDPWFVDQMAQIVELREAIEDTGPDPKLARTAKRFGYSDDQLAYLWNVDPDRVRELRHTWGLEITFKTVDTCAAEFEAATPYYYSAWEEEDEAPPPGDRTVVIIGSGPNRIGQGIEFDYCCVHASQALHDAGYESVMINCNPETVSTDYDVADRLYFEPLTAGDALAVIEKENPVAVVVQLGGQTPLGLVDALERAGVPIAGTPPDAIHLAEDRERFSNLCRQLEVPQPEHGIARSIEQARSTAHTIGFPVLVRPSYVLGGRAMRVIYDEAELDDYLERLEQSPEALAAAPLLVDAFLESAIEVDVDALFDGEDLYLAGVMEHIEQAGVHSGDSACVLPPHTLSDAATEQIENITDRLARGLGVRGLLNIQFAVRNDEVVVLEANPRASRTVPFLSKATGIALARVATRVMMGERLRDLQMAGEMTPVPPGSYTAVKEAVMPWGRFPAEDTVLGPEMRSTGEVMGLGRDLGEAFGKAVIAAGHDLGKGRRVFLSLADQDKPAGIELARLLAGHGCRIYATHGTAGHLARHGVATTHVDKIGEGSFDPVRLIRDGEIDLVINTPSGQRAQTDGRAIRRAAVRHGIPCATTVPGGTAVAMTLGNLGTVGTRVTSLQRYHDG